MHGRVWGFTILIMSITINLQHVLERMRSHGWRPTPAREAVVRVMMGTDRALSVHEVYRRAADHHPRLGMATVYRTLEILETLGFVRKVHTGECHRYYPTPPGHYHPLVCLRCFRVLNFEGNNELAPLKSHLEQQTGFHIQGHLLQFFGYCQECWQDLQAGGEG